MKACPHCGAVLPDEASFCPSCAKSVIIREKARRRKRLPAKAVFVFFAVLAAVLLAVFIWSLPPKTYDNGTAEALYDTKGRTYQLCIAWADTPTIPFSDRYASAAVNSDSRYPSLLFINEASTGEDASGEFLPQVERITAEFASLSPGGGQDMRLSCTPPARQTDYVPHAASITYVDFCIWNDGDYEAQLVFTVNMKNGDTIRVRQAHHFRSIKTYTYTPEDAPMDTLEELQALLEEIGRTAEPDAEINIHLPPVTYEGELVLNRLAVNLYGSLDRTGERTAFTGPVHLAYSGGVISYFEGIDFTGSGGTGISAMSRLHLTNCRLSGWDTAVFCSETAWVNTDQCTFSDNGIGLRINNAEPNISDSRFEGNTFQGNQTAVLLEQVGIETPLKFPGTLFSGNGTDIDNRCGQELDLDRTVFQ
nr:zinc-ribbon domain-containing protein [uncultured Oscillibacter sp.]